MPISHTAAVYMPGLQFKSFAYSPHPKSQKALHQDLGDCTKVSKSNVNLANFTE